MVSRHYCPLSFQKTVVVHLVLFRFPVGPEPQGYRCDNRSAPLSMWKADVTNTYYLVNETNQTQFVLQVQCLSSVLGQAVAQVL